MGSDVDTIKDRLDIAEVISGYTKVEKAGANFKARCPFHNEKTPSFMISPARQSYYCFGCGAKGDIFTFVQEMEGVEFRDALKLLAEKAGVELRNTPSESRTEKDQVVGVLTAASEFFEARLLENEEARKYLLGRGLTEETIKAWRIGYAPAEWRALFSHMKSLGFAKDLLLSAGLIKSTGEAGKEPYDVFRDRITFPLSDANSRIIAFSGRALSKDTEPKYLNSPDTIVFTKSEVLYGLDKAKDEIRKKNYVILVEGQMDLVLSHQAGVKNVVASSGTAFTQHHLERLKRLSPRIILAFDGDEAGEKAAEKSTVLGLSLGMEVKVARLPKGQDPAELVSKDKDALKKVLVEAKPAIEHFLDRILEEEKDHRKQGKLIEKKILPLIALLRSAMEQAHFVSLVSKKTGLKEDVVWMDLRKSLSPVKIAQQGKENDETARQPKRTRLEELAEVKEWLKDDPSDGALRKKEAELVKLIRIDELGKEIILLQQKVARGDESNLPRIMVLTRERDELKRELI